MARRRMRSLWDSSSMPKFRTSPRNSRVRHPLGAAVDENGTPVRARPNAAASRARNERARGGRTPWRRPRVTRVSA